VVVVEPAGGVSRVRHTLPESAAGATLTADDARTVARQTAQARFALDTATLREVSVTPSKLPARTDWLVTFEDRSRPALPQGELRIAVAIAGSEISDTRQFVHVPEQWQRDLRDRRTIAGVVNAGSIALIGGLLLGFATVALIAWSRGHAPDGRPLQLFLLLAAVRALDFANGWPARLAGFSTAQPFTLQAVQLAVGLFVGATLVPAILALAAGSVRRSGTGLLGARQDAWLGLGVGGAASGVLAVAALVRAQSEPLWPSFAGAETLVPVAALPLAAIFSFVSRTILLALLFTATNRLSEHWTVDRGRAAALLLGTGLLLGGGAPGPDLLRWAVGGLLVGLLILAAYIVVFRWDLAPLPVAVAVVSALSALHNGVARPYPGALAGGMLAAVAIGLFAMRIAERRSGEGEGDPVSSGPALQQHGETDPSGDA
jgi:MFS family permease